MVRNIVYALTFSLVSALNAIASDALQERTLPIPGRGVLVLSVPSSWSQQIGQPPEEIAPTIRFSNPAGRKFEIVLTAFWSPKDDSSFNSSANVRSIVEDTLDDLRPRLDQKKIPIRELRGGSETGYFISAPVKTTAPSDFKFLTQGAVAVEDLLVTFTVLTNEKSSPTINHAFDMLRNAKRGT